MISSKRNIKPGHQFNHLFDQAKGDYINTVDGDVFITLREMRSLAKVTQYQTEKFTNYLKSQIYYPKCNHGYERAAAKFIWEFLYNHVQYKEDEKMFEQLRTPARLWADRTTGADCDCYSIFISTVLKNLGIKHHFRLADYGRGYQHVYVIIPIGPNMSKRSDYIVIDPVLHKFNEEKPYSKKYDDMQHQVLNGVGSTVSGFGNEFSRATIDNSLRGLGSISPVGLMENQLREHLLNTFRTLSVAPDRFEPFFDVAAFKEQIAYVLENWDDPIARQAVMEELAEMENNGELAPISLLEQGTGVNGFWDFLKGKRSKSQEKVKNLRARRQKTNRIMPATKRRGTIQKNPTLRNLQTDLDAKTSEFRQKMKQTRGKMTVTKVSPAVRPIRPGQSNRTPIPLPKIGPNTPTQTTRMVCECSPTVSGLAGVNGLGGFWDKARDALNNVKDGIVNAANKVKDKAKEIGNNVKEKVKEVGENIVKNNPVSWGMRNALIKVLENNYLKISSRLYPAVFPPSGADRTELNKLKQVWSKVYQTFEKIGGQPNEIKAAIKKGFDLYVSKSGQAVQPSSGTKKTPGTFPGTFKINTSPTASKIASGNLFRKINGVEGLGGVGAALAAAARAIGGVIAKVVQFMKEKNINFSKLWAKVKGIVPKIKSMLGGGNKQLPQDADFIPGGNAADAITQPIPGGAVNPVNPYVNNGENPSWDEPVYEDFDPGTDPTGDVVPDSSDNGNKESGFPFVPLLIVAGIGTSAYVIKKNRENKSVKTAV